ncbi:MAG: hypothetical protein U1B80_08935, partial [Anaerolineaceae bacterium]|nr:hypothetical protein [Anaerolineaceae bacterium]
QRKAIHSWMRLGRDVEVLLVEREEGIDEAAAEVSVRWLPEVQRNPSGTPLVSSIFDLGREQGRGELLAYVNADIILMPEFMGVCRQVMAQKERFLIVGQRWDLDIQEPINFSDGWDKHLRAEVHQRGRLHPRGGSDYFVFPRVCFTQVPEFAIGRAGWDNWMLFEARNHSWALVDATEVNPIIHQEHDYSHLPNGQSHYRLPETTENVRLAGGLRQVFTLSDTDYRVAGEVVMPQPMSWEKFWREVEIFPLVKLHSRWAGALVYDVFHPKKAYGRVRGWLRTVLKDGS